MDKPVTKAMLEQTKSELIKEFKQFVPKKSIPVLEKICGVEDPLNATIFGLALAIGVLKTPIGKIE